MPSLRLPTREDLAQVGSKLFRPPWRDPLDAATSFVLGTVYYAAGLHELMWDDPRALSWQSYLLFVALCGAQVFRARAPRAALRVGLGIFAASLWSGTSLPIVLVLCDLLYASVLYGPKRRSRVLVWLVATLGVIALAVSVILGRDWRLSFVFTLAVVSVPILPVWWAMQVRLNREMAETERSRAEQLGRLAELDRRAAVAAERSRMARDLHDVVAGHLSAIAIQSEAVLSMAANADQDTRDPRDTVNAVLRSVRENSVQALEEMRAMIGLLRGDDEADPRTAPPRLRDLTPLVESARAGGVDLEVIGEPSALPEPPAAVDLAAYRIVQEALTNIVKHASGVSATLRIEQVGDHLEIDVSNELTALRPDSSSGTGLTNMKDRAHTVGGTLTAGCDGSLWRVHAELPIGVS